MINKWIGISSFALFASFSMAQDSVDGVPLELLPIEGAYVFFEAEEFVEQTKSETRKWYVTAKDSVPDVKPDADPAHFEGADSYVEVLPDTRTNHDEKLIRGENFAPDPGKMAILKYKVEFPKAGKYYVWARAYSTGTEDNGFHIGLNGEWPESGQRWQTVVKDEWHWECKQRTDKVHTGVRMQLYLDIPTAGEHEIAISMREDGAELDKLLLVMDESYRPPGVEPELPKSAAASKSKKPVKIEPQPDGDGSVEVSGELKLWHKTTFTVNGPWAHEQAQTPKNPFTDYKFFVNLVHESGKKITVPGYFAADGNAGESSAESGTKWRAHFAPHLEGKWDYFVTISHAADVAYRDTEQKIGDLGKNAKGSFEIAASDKAAPDFRGRGRLEYVGEHYLKFAGDGSYFLKAGPDAPETFLGYEDFDGTMANNPGKCPLKTWKPHVQDWNEGDPTWQDGKGKGMIGAVNYLAGKGVNSFSFLTYNAGGDGDNVWPFTDRDSKFNYDCSKLDQWGVVFDHATSLGMHLHFKLQETENDDNLKGHKEVKSSKVPTSLDGGDLGRERKLYLQELIARFGHNLALNWNIGEENTQSPHQVRSMAKYIRHMDPYDHPIVIHTFPNQQDKVYTELIGSQSELTGASLQNGWSQVHQRTLKWIQESAKAGKKWVVANDEQGPADLGVPPDPGYRGFDGFAEKDGKKYDLNDIRRDTLWGNLMAGGAGVEYYFGYRLLENDLKMEDFRSRDQSWDFCRIALELFQKNEVPFWAMTNADALVGNRLNENGKPWCLAKEGEVYVIFIPQGVNSIALDLANRVGGFSMTIHDVTASPAAVGQPLDVSGTGGLIVKRPESVKGDMVLLIRKK